MNINNILEVFAPIKFLLINSRIYKYSATLFFVYCTLSQLSRIYMQLRITKLQPVTCYIELISDMIFVTIYSLIAGFSGLYYSLINRKKLTKFVTKTENNLYTLRLYFNSTISLNRQRQLARFCVITIILHKMICLIIGLIFTKIRPEFKADTFSYALFVVTTTTSSMLMLSIRLLTLAFLVLLSIVANQLQALIRVDCKGSLKYGKINVEIFQQSSILIEIFGVITLTTLGNSFGDIFNAMWNISMPNGSCILGDSISILATCCIWSIAVIGSGERVNIEVWICFMLFI